MKKNIFSKILFLHALFLTFSSASNSDLKNLCEELSLYPPFNPQTIESAHDSLTSSDEEEDNLIEFANNLTHLKPHNLKYIDPIVIEEAKNSTAAIKRIIDLSLDGLIHKKIARQFLFHVTPSHDDFRTILINIRLNKELPSRIAHEIYIGCNVNSSDYINQLLVVESFGHQIRTQASEQFYERFFEKVCHLAFNLGFHQTFVDEHHRNYNQLDAAIILQFQLGNFLVKHSLEIMESSHISDEDLCYNVDLGIKRLRDAYESGYPDAGNSLREWRHHIRYFAKRIHQKKGKSKNLKFTIQRLKQHLRYIKTIDRIRDFRYFSLDD